MIHGPAVISLSGGRTSARMLRMLLDEGIGEDVFTIFTNTGREHKRTLDYVEEISQRWGVEERQRKIAAEAGIDYGDDKVDKWFQRVDYATASRDGEPFENLINLTGLPNYGTPFCSTEIKTRLIKQFMISLGHERWDSYVGIRADEAHRVAKMRANATKGFEPWDLIAPLVDRGVTSRDVFDFWLGPSWNPGDPFPERLPQGFDLLLQPEEGNCLFCFKKSPDKLVRLASKYPAEFEWAKEQERRTGSVWRRNFGPMTWIDSAMRQGSLPIVGDALPCNCTD